MGHAPVRGGRGGALVLMALAVVLGSFVPLVIALGGGADAPFLFNSCWRLGAALGCFVVEVVFFRDLVGDGWRILWRCRGTGWFWAAGAALLGTLDYALFSASIQFVDVSVATVLIETYPVALVAVLVLTGSSRMRRIGFGRLFGGLLASFVGVLLVTAGQAGGGLSVLRGLGDGGWGFAPGVALTLGVVLVVALTGFVLRWCEAVGMRFAAVAEMPVDPRAVAVCLLVGVLAVMNLVSVPLNLVVGLALGETLGVRSLLVAVFVGGLGVQAVTSVGWRAANLMSEDPGVNGLLYVVLPLSLAWLWLFGQVEVASFGYVLCGAALVLLANAGLSLLRRCGVRR